MKKARILNVVGARPNFMKMAPILRQLARYDTFQSYLVHTGQHYDLEMSRVFFRDLGMLEPDFNLNVGSGSHAVQTAEIMRLFEEVCCSVDPDLLVVAGDVNSTSACALTAAKLCIPVAHIEAGLRSFDRTMPEEINRIVTDAVSDLLFTTEQSGNENLLREGVRKDRICFVGNTMIDSLTNSLTICDEIPLNPKQLSLNRTGYFLATMHRPSNVDNPNHLLHIMGILEAASRLAPVLFVTHPRTRDRLQYLESGGKWTIFGQSTKEILPGFIYLLPPLPYLEFLSLLSKSRAVLTDSGGIQEETTFLRIPCLTLRENTERPITVEIGSNKIVGLDKEMILSSLSSILAGHWKRALVPPLWDGHAAERIVKEIQRFVEAQ